MKRIFTFFVLILSFCLAFGQHAGTRDCVAVDLPFSEGAEGDISCWTIVNGGTSEMTWTKISEIIEMEGMGISGSEVSHSGNDCFAVTPFGGEGLGYPSDYLISPEIALPSTGSAQLSFYVRAFIPTDESEHYSVLISTASDTASFQTVLLSEDVEGDQWQLRTVDLSGYAGQNVYIAWKYRDPIEPYLLLLDDISVVNFSVASLFATPNNIDFGLNIIGNEKVKTSTVSAFLLTEGITASVEAPFSVSANGTDFSESVTLPQDGGLLYVKFSASVEGVQNAEVSLSSGEISASIAVVGEGVDCGPAIESPFVEYFTAPADLTCWQIIDANDDGATFVFEEWAAVYNYSVSNDADDWLVSPALNIDEAKKVSIDYHNGGFGREKFIVYALENTNDLTSAVAISDTIVTINSQTNTLVCNIPAEFIGGEARVAVKCVSPADTYKLYIDNFNFYSGSQPLLDVDVDNLAFGELNVGVEAVREVVVTAENLTEDIVVESSEPYWLSADGENFSLSLVMSQNGGSLFVKYQPTQTGDFYDVVELTCGELSTYISVSGSAVDCQSPISEFPFYENFESGISQCWLNVDNDQDGYLWINPVDYSGLGISGRNESMGCAVSQSYALGAGALSPDNWLITKPIAVPEEGAFVLSFFVAAQDGSYPAEHYGVYISTTTPDISEFELVYEETLDRNGGARTQGTWKNKNVSLTDYAGQTIYVAWRHFDCTDQYAFLLDDISIAEKFVIVATAGEGGSITPEGEVFVEEGESQSFEVLANENYAILGITVDGVAIDLEGDDLLQYTYTFENIAESHSINVEFVETTSAGLCDSVYMSVYPNPASQIVTISGVEGGDVLIVNNLGQIVMTVENASSSQQIDISGLASGTYLVKAGSDVLKLNVVR
ncbi:MAG: T9SS type A sorting domain-containing protein [Bacteroidales bacterium]|nr:T9SS type A sorting domain-containing protein [Bacteroidales bacterium]